MVFPVNAYVKKAPFEGTSPASQNIFYFKAITQAST